MTVFNKKRTIDIVDITNKKTKQAHSACSSSNTRREKTSGQYQMGLNLKKALSLSLFCILLLCLLTACGKISSDSISLSAEQTSVLDSVYTAVPTVDAAEAPISETPEPAPISVVPDDSTFEVYFIDVGEADAIVVQCDGHAMMIDGGSSGDSDLIFSFLKKHEISHLDYIFNTHPDEDHVGGLAGALNYANVDRAFSSVLQRDAESFQNFLKYLDKQGVTLECPARGDSFSLGSSNITVLATAEDMAFSENSSLVLRLEYGNTSFLFMGDAESDEEEYLVSKYGAGLRSDVLKIGHHGSDTSSSEKFLSMVSAPFCVISVGGANSYGHPTQTVLNRLKETDTNLYRTDIHGTIHCVSDGSKITFDVERNADKDAFAYAAGYDNALERERQEEKQRLVEESSAAEVERNASAVTGTDYIVNTNSGKFHYPGCSSVSQMKESNKWYYTGTREDLISQGYSPCGRCNP